MSELRNPDSYPSHGKKKKSERKQSKGAGESYLLSADSDIRGPTPGPKVEVRQPVNDTSNLRMVNSNNKMPHEKKDTRHDL